MLDILGIIDMIRTNDFYKLILVSIIVFPTVLFFTREKKIKSNSRAPIQQTDVTEGTST